MRIAFLVSDNREIERNYSPDRPYFGTAPTGLLDGFAMLEYATDVETQRSEGIQNPKSEIQNSSLRAEIHVISCTQVPMASPAKLAPNIHFHSLHVPKWGWLKSGYAGCTMAIRKKLREIRPDMVHAQGTERENAMAAVFSPYPRVLTIHGNLRLIRSVLKPRPWSSLALQSLLEAYAVPKFDGIVCITRYTQSAVAHETPKTWIVPNAVDPDFLALGEERETQRNLADAEIQNPKSRIQNPPPIIPNSPSQFPAPAPHSKSIIQHPASQNYPVILVVANVDARKNQNAFILALDGLAKERKFQLNFFGRKDEGGYGAEFDGLVAARTWCEYGGMISRAELREEFRQADIVALPTNEDNCPMVVLEAQAAGLPVMASNVGGVPDLVEDGVTGLLTDPASPESMSKAIERLLTDPELVATLVKNGRRQAIEKFHPRVIAQRHLQIYREILDAV